jgi:RimJ/RimL family protein N-acetyltransferase
MLVVAGTSSEPPVELRIVSPLDKAWHASAAPHIFAAEMFWNDQMRLSPQATYISIFANPYNCVIDVGGDGVIACSPAMNKTRAYLHGISWGRAAMRCHKARRVALAVALDALEVTRIEGATRHDNTRAIRAMERAGMKKGGRMVGGLWYRFRTRPYIGVPHGRQ